MSEKKTASDRKKTEYFLSLSLCLFFLVQGKKNEKKRKKTTKQTEKKMPVRHLELATTTTTTTATTATLIESDGRRSTIGRWGRRPPPQKGRGPAHQEERRGRGRCLCVCVCVCVSVFSSVCVAYRSTVSTATAVVAAPPARPLRFVHPVSVRASVRPCVLGFSLTADEITERERERECVPQAGRHVGPAPQRVFLVAHRYVEPPQEPVHKIKKKTQHQLGTMSSMGSRSWSVLNHVISFLLHS